MEKENPVIKNYILSSEKRVISYDTPPKSLIKSLLTESSKYHELLEQNKVFSYPFL